MPIRVLRDRNDFAKIHNLHGFLLLASPLTNDPGELHEGGRHAKSTTRLDIPLVCALDDVSSCMKPSVALERSWKRLVHLAENTIFQSRHLAILLMLFEHLLLNPNQIKCTNVLAA